MPCTITAAEHPSPPSFIMQTRCSTRLSGSRSSQPSAWLLAAARRLPEPRRGAAHRPAAPTPSLCVPSAGSAAAAGPSPLPAGLTANPPPRAGVCGTGGQQAASSESGTGCCLRSSPRPVAGQRCGHRAGLHPHRQRGPLRAAGRTAGSAASHHSRCAPSASSVEGLRGDEASPRPLQAAPGRPRSPEAPPGRSGVEPLTWSQAQSPESCSEEKEPHPPGAAAAGLACSREGASAGGKQQRRRALVPLPRRLRCGEAPREQAGEPARLPPCPAPHRAPASPELSAETVRNCTRSESWGAAPPPSSSTM